LARGQSSDPSFHFFVHGYFLPMGLTHHKAPYGGWALSRQRG
jgi:hypothetical protein